MLSIKYEGAGWMFPFYFGVGKFIQQYIDIDSKEVNMGGNSAGAFTALITLLDENFDEIFDKIMINHKEMRYNPFRIKESLNYILYEYVPQKIDHLQNRLLIGLSKLSNFKLTSHTISNYSTRQMCLDTIRASCHIPLLCGINPYYINGNAYYDGGIVSEFKKLKNTSAADTSADTSANIVVDILNDSSKICPGVDIPTLWRYYPPDIFILKTIMNLGFECAHEYFWQNNIKLDKYIIRPIPIPDKNKKTLYQEIIKYGIRKREICNIMHPFITLINLNSVRSVLIVLFLYKLHRRIGIWILKLLKIIR